MKAILTALATACTLASVPQAQERAVFRRDSVEHQPQISSPVFDAKPDLSHDKLTLWLASDRVGGVGDLDLWVSTRPELTSPFAPASNVTELNSPERDHTPTTSPDGLTMIFSSNRVGSDDDDGWMTTRPDVNSPWTTPTLIPLINSSGRDMGFSLTEDELTLYLTSNRTGFGGFDIYASTRATRTSAWGAAERVVGLSTPWEDLFPTVTGDGNTIYFSSNRPGSQINPTTQNPGNDIWVAMRADASSPWVVENLFELNGPFNEVLMTIADDESEFFFTSNRPGGLGGLDIYRALPYPTIRRFGVGTVGEAGLPQIHPIGGNPSVGNEDFGHELTGVSPHTLAFVRVGFDTMPGPLLVTEAGATDFVIHTPSFNNPPSSEPRIVSTPIPLSPDLVGREVYVQGIFVWDPLGQEQLNGIPYSATPGLIQVLMPFEKRRRASDPEVLTDRILIE